MVTTDHHNLDNSGQELDKPCNVTTLRHLHSGPRHNLCAILAFANKQQKTLPIFEWTGFRVVVGRAGVEPTTNGLKVRCSTN